MLWALAVELRLTQEPEKSSRKSGRGGTSSSHAGGSQCTSDGGWWAINSVRLISGASLPGLRRLSFLVRLSGRFIRHFFILFFFGGFFLGCFLFFVDQGFLFFFTIGAFGDIAR